MCNWAYIYANLRRMCMSLFFFNTLAALRPCLGNGYIYVNLIEIYMIQVLTY